MSDRWKVTRTNYRAQRMKHKVRSTNYKVQSTVIGDWGMHRVFAVILITLFFSLSAVSQGRSFWIIVKDDYAPSDSDQLIFGNFPSATFGLDSFSQGCREFEAFNDVPSFDIRWNNIPGRLNQWGFGLYKLDFRALTSPSGK